MMVMLAARAYRLFDGFLNRKECAIATAQPSWLVRASLPVSGLKTDRGQYSSIKKWRRVFGLTALEVKPTPKM